MSKKKYNNRIVKVNSESTIARAIRKHRKNICSHRRTISRLLTKIRQTGKTVLCSVVGNFKFKAVKAGNDVTVYCGNLGNNATRPVAIYDRGENPSVVHIDG